MGVHANPPDTLQTLIMAVWKNCLIVTNNLGPRSQREPPPRVCAPPFATTGSHGTTRPFHICANHVEIWTFVPNRLGVGRHIGICAGKGCTRRTLDGARSGRFADSHSLLAVSCGHIAHLDCVDPCPSPPVVAGSVCDARPPVMTNGVTGDTLDFLCGRSATA